MPKMIQFIIKPDGEVVIDVLNNGGQNCHDITKAFEDALGGDIEDVTQKSGEGVAAQESVYAQE